MNRLFPLTLLAIISFPCFSQTNFNVTDPEKDFKVAKEYFVKQQYGLAYPLFQELKHQYPENTGSSHTYLNQDIDYYSIVCGLHLNQQVSESAAIRFINVANDAF